jgi:hypothetical protein
MVSILREASLALVVGFLSTSAFASPSSMHLDGSYGTQAQNIADGAGGSPPSAGISHPSHALTAQGSIGSSAPSEAQSHDRGRKGPSKASIGLARNFWIKWLVPAHR